MADVTGGTPPTNASPFGVPADIKAVYDHFGDAGMYSVATAAGLPGSGNWVGRILTAEDTDVPYVWTGSGWSRIMQSGGVKASAAGITESIPAAPATTVNFPTGRFTAAPAVVANIRSGAAGAGGATAKITAVTSSSFQIVPSVSGFDWSWIAMEVG